MVETIFDHYANREFISLIVHLYLFNFPFSDSIPGRLLSHIPNSVPAELRILKAHRTSAIAQRCPLHLHVLIVLHQVVQSKSQSCRGSREKVAARRKKDALRRE